MAQLHLDATVTDGSANVTLPGDVVAQIKAGDYFKLVGRVGVYEIASRSLVSGNTRITLTAPYVGDSGTYPALVHRDFTERGYPLFYEGDLDIPDILRRWALRMDGEVTDVEDATAQSAATLQQIVSRVDWASSAYYRGAFRFSVSLSDPPVFLPLRPGACDILICAITSGTSTRTGLWGRFKLTSSGTWEYQHIFGQLGSSNHPKPVIHNGLPAFASDHESLYPFLVDYIQCVDSHYSRDPFNFFTKLYHTGNTAQLANDLLVTNSALARGAIVEQGTNANGSYWRWESGLQVCIRASYSLVGHTANNPLQITFPAVFIAAPSLATSMFRDLFDSTHAENKIMNGPPGADGFQQAHTAGPLSGIIAAYIAIGRWK